ncbi:MAG TPA: hypothetical protein VKQ54_13840 [Caulobacteraceae bacterium]|nr:hypothetical protein [Caulobacteraceae bacterium]
MPQPTALEVVASAATDDPVRPTWVPAPRPNDFLEGFAPIGEVLKTLNLDSPADGLLGLTISGVALARGVRDHDNVGVGLAAASVALTGLGFIQHTLAHIHPALPGAVHFAREAAQALQDSRMASISETARSFALSGIGSPYGPARGG